MAGASKNHFSSPDLQSALAQYKSGRHADAEALCRRVLADDPGNVASLRMLGTIAGEAGRFDEATGLFSQALKLDKNDPQLFFDLGVALFKSGKMDEALLKYKKAVALDPGFIAAHINMADILDKQGKFDEAALRYRRILDLKPQDSAAIYYALARALNELGKIDEAIATYRKALALNPAMAEACNNLGVIFKIRNDPAAARDMYEKAIVIKPDHVMARFNLANLQQDQGQPEEAIAQYAQAIAVKPDFAEAYLPLGKLLKKRGMGDEALLLFRQLAALRPDNAAYLMELVDLCHGLCAWDTIAADEARLVDMIRRGDEGISPFVAMTTPATAADLLACARSFTKGRQLPHALFTHKPGKTEGRIKIGYLSSDYYNHATAHLMAELFERHDRSRFTVTAYSYGNAPEDAMRKRLMKAFDAFTDLNGLSDADAAAKIHADGTHILVDLKGGFTEDARINIAACRPAPVQAGYIGYPGTMGVDCIDYIIADRFIIPADREQFYSEKVICLPGCYQPNDTHRPVADKTPARKDCGLPERGFVFCSFNANYKITPQIFDIWMRLLQKTPASVLWLLGDKPAVIRNLRQEAARRGVEPERLVFAPKVPLPEHLARQKLADLFLDTLPVNAHTTTSDALWIGLPVVTCAGSAFAGRVAGSLLQAAHLPELVVHTLEDYEALALHLAHNPLELSELRKKIESTRLQVPLFDIETFTRNLEKSYQTMWNIWQAGESPRPFTIS